MAKQTKSEPVHENVGSTPFITATTACDAYIETKRWMRVYHEPIDEYERLMRGKPSANIPKELPKVTDGTIASIISDDPKRIIQQEPTGIIRCHDYPEYAQVADYELVHTLIPMANRGGSELQKDWIMTGKSLGWGRATSYTFYTSTNGIMHADFVIPYVKDVLTEKGKVFAPDSNIRFMRSWYSKRDIQAIINREKAMTERIKGYKPEWDLKKLADFMDGGASQKPADVQTPAEREKGGDTGGFEVIHAFQRGYNTQFYSFSPQYKDGDNLRTKQNNDPRGEMPFDDMYYDIDLSNPLGRGIVEAHGGKQNLIDQQMQMFQFTSTLMQAPPAITFGNVNKASMKMRPNAVWDGGSAQNRIEFLKVDNSQIVNFASNYGLLKSQILQGASSAQAQTIGADAGNPSFAKTPAGTKAQAAQMNISDNYLRKQFEEWKGRQWETATNIYFSEMKGTKKHKLDGDDLKDMLKTDAKKFIKGDTLTIPFKEIEKIAFKFEVDPSSSEVKEDADNVEKLTEVYKILQSDPDPSLADKKTKLLQVLINEIGAEGTDDLFPELDENNQDPNGQAQPQQQQITPQMVQQIVMQMMEQAKEAEKQQPKNIAESLAIKFADLPEDAKQQVLEQIGIHSTMPSPQHIDQTNKTLDAAHSQQHAQDTHQFNVEKAAVDTLQNDSQQEAQNQQAQQSHELASKQAESQAQAPQGSPEQPQQPALDDALSPEEEQVVQQLLHRGFDENDAEQAIVMLRQGVPVEQIIQALGAKRGQMA